MQRAATKPAESPDDRNVRTVVRLLLEITGTTKDELGEWLDKGRSSIDAKLNGSVRFSVEEVGIMARHWRVDPGRFFEDPASLFGVAAKGAYLTSPQEQLELDLAA